MAAPDSGIRLDRITKRFGDFTAVDGVSLDVERGTFFSLLGPSGCGKTTLLRMIAGFETPTAGQIFIDGRDVTTLPPQERPTAMVFQSYALFPTMTVGENVAYGLRVRRVAKSERGERVRRALDRVGLAAQVDKPVTQLSGGQQQRVALARALAVEPDVILFDEPLSNLDAELREQTRRELKELQHTLGTTSLYVTHDQQEALALSDRLAVMRAGHVVQTGTPLALYQQPETAFIARFLGGSNLVASEAVATQLAGQAVPSGHVLAVRPEHLTLAEAGVAARVRTRQFLGTHDEWWLDADGEPLRLWTSPGTPVPDAVRVRAETFRWVRPD